MKLEHQQRMYDALREISKAQKPERLLNHSWDDWGLEDGTEALTYAYENVVGMAKHAVKGLRRPK